MTDDRCEHHKCPKCMEERRAEAFGTRPEPDDPPFIPVAIVSLVMLALFVLGALWLTGGI